MARESCYVNCTNPPKHTFQKTFIMSASHHQATATLNRNCVGLTLPLFLSNISCAMLKRWYMTLNLNKRRTKGCCLSRSCLVWYCLKLYLVSLWCGCVIDQHDWRRVPESINTLLVGCDSYGWHTQHAAVSGWLMGWGSFQGCRFFISVWEVLSYMRNMLSHADVELKSLQSPRDCDDDGLHVPAIRP